MALSRMGEGKAISLDRVAKATQISRRYLEQLAMSLRTASLVRSVAGRNGGYLLAQPAKEIRLGRIIEASIGPINIVECVGRPETCLKADVCECRLLYSMVNQRIETAFNEFTLADLSDKKWRRRMARRLEGMKSGEKRM